MVETNSYSNSNSTTNDTSDIDKKILKFWEDNPRGSVFDEDEDDTGFKKFKLSKTAILEVDESIDESSLQEFKEEFEQAWVK